MRFDDDHIAKARPYLIGEHSGDLIKYMQCKSLSLDVTNISTEAVEIARKLGWVSGPGDQLAGVGLFAADSCREYQFWLERDKALPFEGAAEHLSAPYFKGKSVLEIGSGMGVNLLSFSSAGASVSGLEPIESYAQMGEIFSEREGLSRPDVRQGSAEDLPFDDACFEQVLCISAHQYFDMHKALAEIARVLKPEGELIIVGRTFDRYMRDNLAKALQNPIGSKGFVISAINTFSYASLGRRIIPQSGDFSTSRPVYPTQGSIIRWSKRAGFTLASDVGKAGRATSFHFRLKHV